MVDKKYYVNFGPELLKLLGPNLYTNIYYVLGELIANAYDADAQNVYILYDTDKNTITVEDDGTGMSYAEFNDRFLPIGIPSRTRAEDVYTDSGERRRIGRKGIGKLAALSVAEQVRVISVRDGDKSGCILSLNMSSHDQATGRYIVPSIEEKDIHFSRIDEAKSGSAIIMENSKYSMNKTVDSVKRNISLIFPFACQTFKIHLENLKTGSKATIDDTTKEIVKASDTLITFSEEGSRYDKYLRDLYQSFNEGRYYEDLQEKLPRDKWPKPKQLRIAKSPLKEKMTLQTVSGEMKDFELTIEGWVSTYASTRDKNRDTDFPVSHISLIANDKLGQFDILPEISTDRLNEAYVVGNFFVDLLEETELPDIASSNRQGYQEDDPRFRHARDLIKEGALKPILQLKAAATIEKNYADELGREDRQRTLKERYEKSIQELYRDPSLGKLLLESEPTRTTVERTLGLKSAVEETYKKVMISHDSRDKELVDELEKVLHFCGFQKEEILYTSSNYLESNIRVYADIYEYLREFFVGTAYRTDLCVIYVFNKAFAKKWNPVLEAGAGWVLRSTAYPMFTDRFSSVRTPFSQCSYDPKLAFGMDDRKVQTLADAIHQIAQHASKNTQTEASIISFIKSSTKLYGPQIQGPKNSRTQNGNRYNKNKSPSHRDIRIVHNLGSGQRRRP